MGRDINRAEPATTEKVIALATMTRHAERAAGMQNGGYGDKGVQGGMSR